MRLYFSKQPWARYLPTLWAINLAFTGCAITPAVKNQYTINNYQTTTRYASKHKLPAIHIGTPEAITHLETDQMFYTKIPYEDKAFAHNAWTSAPSDMIYPLIIQSIQKSRAFRAVSSGAHTESYTYRLDTQIIKLIQNFTVHPSRLDLIINATLVENDTGHILASRLFQYDIPCPSDTPYGGTLAANRASGQFTYDLTRFTITTLHRHPLKASHRDTKMLFPFSEPAPAVAPAPAAAKPAPKPAPSAPAVAPKSRKPAK